MKYFTYQGNDHDCGFAALKMFLANLAQDESYLYIPKPSKREFYNLDDLVNIANQYGLDVEACSCSKDYYDCLDEPSLTLIDNNHVVMVKKKNDKRIVLYDPDRGIIKIRKDEFLRRWRCIVLEANNPEGVVKINNINRRLLPQKLNILNCLVALISTGLLIAAFYLLNKSENFLFSLLFLFLFIGCQIAEKCILYKQVQTFDNEYIPKFFTAKKNCKREKYAEFSEYKRKFFTSNRQTLVSILIAFTITFLLCFNDFRNVFVLLALILIKLLDIIVFSRVEDDTRNRIAEIESQSYQDSLMMKTLALDAHSKANVHSFLLSIKEIFYIFIAFVFATVMMFITNNIGCNFVIFHFVMYYSGFLSYNQLLNNLSLRKENAKLQCRFFDSCNL